jgi:hypothetical protein
MKGALTMKLHSVIVLAALLLSACQKATNHEATTRAADASPATSSQAAAPQSTSGTPVEFTYTGITPDKANVAYKIKVNTDKPIDEVHLAFKDMDPRGKVLDDTIIIWQNMAGSTRRPIEKGQTYDDQTALDPAATKADVSLKEVIFKDGSKWTAR